MKKIYFTCSNKNLNLAAYAIAKDGESDVDAVQRSIARTTGTRVFGGRSLHHTEDRKGNKSSETFNMTLTEKKAVRGGHAVIAEVRVTL